MATSLLPSVPGPPTTVASAEDVAALGRAYLYGDLDAGRRRTLEATLYGVLDHPSSQVRRALAETLAEARHAPHSLVLALADDQSSVAATVLARSPVLTDADLIDCAAGSDSMAQAAVASRPFLSAAVAAAIAEIGSIDALVVLAANAGAIIPTFSLARMVERHGASAALREALLVRKDVPSTVRFDLVVATTRALAGFVSASNWMSDERMRRVAIEARDRAVVTIAQGMRETPQDGAAALAAHLRAAGQLTTGLALRIVLSGRLDLFRAILVELSACSPQRVDALIAHCAGSGFAALYRRSGLPCDLLPAFRSAVHAVTTSTRQAPSSGLHRRAIATVIKDCVAVNDGELDKVLVLLRRLDAEAARDEARIAAPTPRRLTDSDDRPLLLSDLDDEVPLLTFGTQGHALARGADPSADQRFAA